VISRLLKILGIAGFKGATMYEWQIGRLYGGWCHLSGDYWNGKPWRRLSFGWEERKDEAVWRSKRA
jgi:hypothetical protein